MPQQQQQQRFFKSFWTTTTASSSSFPSNKDVIVTRMTTLVLLVFVLLFGTAGSVTQEGSSSKRVLKATTVQIPPFLMMSGEGRDANMKGFIVDLLEEMEKIMNVSFEIVHVKDGKWGGRSDTGNWTGMIGEVKNGDADIAAAPLTVTSSRLLHVDMSHPFLRDSLKIVIKKPSRRDSWNDLFFALHPFTPESWVLILVSFGLTGITLGVIGRFSPFEWTNTSAVQVSKEKRESFNWQNSLWFIITTFMWQGYRHFPRSYSGRILSVFWWMFALFTLVLYIGCIAAHLVSVPAPIIHLPFMTFNEMSHQTEVSYGTLKSSSTYRYFQQSNRATERRIYNGMSLSEQNLAGSIDEGLEKVRSSNGRYAFIMEGSLADYKVSQYPCDLMTVGGGSMRPYGYAFVTDKGSPLSSEVNHAVLKLQEMGVIEKIQLKWREGECYKRLGREIFLDDETYDDKPSKRLSNGYLGARLIAGPLILLLVGIIISGAVLVGELLLARKEVKPESDDDHQLRDSFEDGN